MTTLQVAAPALVQKAGRVWLQRTELNPYFPLSDAGLSGANFPEATQTAIRGQATNTRTGSEVVDVTDGDTELAAFSIPTRLFEVRNYLIGIAKEKINVQLHTGPTGNPTQYDGAKYGFGWVLARRGTGTIDILAILDNAGEGLPVSAEFPFVPTIGPVPLDWTIALSRRTTVEVDDANGIFTIPEAKDDAPSRKALSGEVGMIVHEAGAGVPSNPYFFKDGLKTAPTVCPALPFGNDIHLLAVTGYGDKLAPRFIVSADTQVAAFAQIAYTDDYGTSWTGPINVSTTNADQINAFSILNASKIYGAGGRAANSLVWMSADGGATWDETDVGLAQPINAISIMPNGIGWIGGPSNTIARVNNYNLWTVKTGPSDGAGDAILAVDVKKSTGTVFIGNDAGELYASDDDGASWQTLTATIQGVTATSINHIQFDPWSGELGYMEVSTAADRVILRTTDGGATWRRYSLGSGGLSNIAQNSLHVAGPNQILTCGAASGGTATILQAQTEFDGGLQK